MRKKKNIMDKRKWQQVENVLKSKAVLHFI